ncbi:hypothetical protein BU24DRAFT_229440 [Aaosphaeria arxii CBS 175.79]|uniref:Secreted protein n=1 Tax=Aaosphaeria arxii CBS 175.79 TaxID=1450172 RepID=A0A6A5XPK6_9PLEO|nr:uncharacterized protein BU24DRAFT_229440 [Aaosphaeria arxii CBS 175.79]KAF2015195.1 hypothetical protein BU24DRAFT_229440 [Aaosphaeria arxii CBS 175.79]
MLAWLLAALVWPVRRHHHIKTRCPRRPTLLPSSSLPSLHLAHLAPSSLVVRNSPIEAFSLHLAVIPLLHCPIVSIFFPCSSTEDDFRRTPSGGPNSSLSPPMSSDSPNPGWILAAQVRSLSP